MELFACRADIDITLSLIAEEARAEKFSAVVVIGKGNVGADTLGFVGDDVVFGAVLAIPGSLPGPQLPPKARAEDEIEHGFVFRDFRGSNQNIQDHARLAPWSEL